MTERTPDHPDFIDFCINCQRLLFSGDKGLRYEDSVYACEECAPTYAQAKEAWDEQKHDLPDAYAAFIFAMRDHAAAGGSMEDKFLTDL